MTSDGSCDLVLIVDDDVHQAAAISAALHAAGYRAQHRTDSLAGLVAVEEEVPAVVILDWGLPFVDGAIFLSALRPGLPALPPVIALVDETADPNQVRQLGAHAALRTPPNLTQLLGAVTAVVKPAA